LRWRKYSGTENPEPLAAIGSVRSTIRERVVTSRDIAEDAANLDARPLLSLEAAASFVAYIVRRFTEFCNSAFDEDEEEGVEAAVEDAVAEAADIRSEGDLPQDNAE